MRDRMVWIVAWIGVYETMNVGAGRQQDNAFVAPLLIDFLRRWSVLWAFTA